MNDQTDSVIEAQSWSNLGLQVQLDAERPLDVEDVEGDDRSS